jgi:Asp-tRNA(Asn)/Glu-tRNA(Gln) amidotransferase B subunit
MATTEERLQILKMIEEGKISAAEGAELLRAMETKGERGPALEPMKGTSNPRWFRVRVTDMQTGRNKVNVNIPMGLVNVGIKMGARFAPQIEGKELNTIMDAVRSGQLGKIVDIVDADDGERVEIFVE